MAVGGSGGLSAAAAASPQWIDCSGDGRARTLHRRGAWATPSVPRVGASGCHPSSPLLPPHSPFQVAAVLTPSEEALLAQGADANDMIARAAEFQEMIDRYAGGAGGKVRARVVRTHAQTHARRVRVPFSAHARSYTHAHTRDARTHSLCRRRPRKALRARLRRGMRCWSAYACCRACRQSCWRWRRVLRRVRKRRRRARRAGERSAPL